MQLRKKNYIPIVFLLILILWVILAQLNFNDPALISKIYKFLIDNIKNNFTFSIISYLIIYFFCVSFSIPIASYLTIIGGAIFNWLALPLVLLSASSGAIVIFLLSRSVLADFFLKKIEGRYENFKIGFSKNNFFYLLFLRLVPFAPFFVINILAGIMNMRTIPYILATFIGIIPGTTIYIWIGITLGELLIISEISNFNLISSKYFLPVLLLSFLSLSPIFFNRIYKYYTNY